jgi:hypothetical protein
MGRQNFSDDARDTPDIYCEFDFHQMADALTCTASAKPGICSQRTDESEGLLINVKSRDCDERRNAWPARIPIFKIKSTPTSQHSIHQESFMPNLPASLFRIVVMAAFVGGLGFSGASYADTPDQPQTTMDQTSPMLKLHGDGAKMRHDQKAMEQHVEQRIKTLHDKLDIAPAQEAKWADVAQTMRDNEASIDQLVKQRSENRKTMNAIDDLQSYEAIAEAHADGLKKMIPVFQTLYADMSDGQKKKADEAFGRFEGYRGGKSAKKHG